MQKLSPGVQSAAEDTDEILRPRDPLFGILGSQARYSEDVHLRGIDRPNSAFFAIESSELLQNLNSYFFTIVLSVYHAISLLTQERLLTGQWESFSDYYSKHPEDLPVIHIAQGNLVRQISQNQEKQPRYRKIGEQETSTFPYGKIGDFQPVSSEEILGSIQVSLDDISNAETEIDLNFRSPEVVRFFMKTFQGQERTSSNSFDKILSNRTILPFCENLAAVLIERIRKAFIQYHGSKFGIFLANYGVNQGIPVNFPSGIASISSYLKFAGFQSDYCDFQGQVDDVERTVAYIHDRAIRLFGISAHPGSMSRIRSVIERVHASFPKNQSPHIVVGNRAMNVPDNARDLRSRYPGVSIIIGEGELAMKKLAIQVLNAGTTFQGETYVPGKRKIEGDDFPVLNIPDHVSYDVPLVESSRGCGYGICSFCKRLEDSEEWRRIPNAIVIENIRQHLQHGKNFIYFIDEEFFSGGSLDNNAIAEIEQFVKMVEDAGLSFQFRFQTRAKTIIDRRYGDRIQQLLRDLKNIGLKTVFLGIESFSSSQLRRYKKGSSPQANLEAIKVLSDLGIEVMLGFIPLDPLMEIEEVAENIRVLESSICNGKPLYNYTPNLATPLEVYYASPYAAMLLDEDKKRATEGQSPLISGFDADTGTYQYQFKDPRMDRFLKYYRDRWYKPFQNRWRSVKQTRQVHHDEDLDRIYEQYNELNFYFFKALYEIVLTDAPNSTFEETLEQFLRKREELFLGL